MGYCDDPCTILSISILTSQQECGKHQVKGYSSMYRGESSVLAVVQAKDASSSGQRRLKMLPQSNILASVIRTRLQVARLILCGLKQG